MNTKAVRLRMAEDFLLDAELETSSIGRQATAAFNAGFFLLVALEAPTGVLTPGLGLLTQAATRFGLEPSVMEPAWTFIAHKDLHRKRPAMTS